MDYEGRGLMEKIGVAMVKRCIRILAEGIPMVTFLNRRASMYIFRFRHAYMNGREHANTIDV